MERGALWGRPARGFTLIELMIAVALISVGILASVEAFTGIQKSIQYSKAKALASNIGQEKMQIIMQKPYYEVLVTTAPNYSVQPSTTFAYDNGYFRPETLEEGGMFFTRYTNVQVIQENSGSIQTLPPYTPDTGMRQITETVVWTTDDGNKMITMQNVLNNPNTVMSNAVLQGVVTNAITLIGIPSALVNAAENIGWRDNADAGGNYKINLAAGGFSFRASAPGYYPQIVTLSVPPNTNTTQNFSLVPMSSGTVQGTVWFNNHLVISQVVSSTGPSNSMEYIELYNPSTAAVTMGSNLSYFNANIWVATFDASGNVQSRPELVYISTTIPSNGFYLISNTGDGNGPSAAVSCAPLTINGTSVNPDACWRFAGMPRHLLQCNTLPGGGGGCGYGLNASGIEVGSTGGLAWTGTLLNVSKIDGIAWTGSGVVPTAYETAPKVPSVLTGMVPGEDFVRRADTSTAWTTSFGNAYDSNNNLVDFIDYAGPPFAPRISTTLRAPLTGTPAVGAIVSVTDTLSVASTATLVGSGLTPPVAFFSVPSVATGTWIVFIDSGGLSAEIDNVIVAGNTMTPIPNAVTLPPWSATADYDTVLTSAGVVGTINGSVTDTLGVPISGGILVTAGSYSTTTGANGNYFVRVTTGIYNVAANPGNANATYAADTLTNVTVNLGDVTANENFQLPKGGKITGWTTRDGINALQGVTVVALDSGGIAQDTEVSGYNGSFLLVNLSTGNYSVMPVLDSKENCSPSAATVTVTAGNTVVAGTFTVTGALGSINGNVTAGGVAIPSGVLVIASTSTISIPLPALSSATLTGSPYYADSSHEDGSYSLNVRGSTSTLYNVTAFYMRVNNNVPQLSSSTVSNVSVIAGGSTGVNFAW